MQVGVPHISKYLREEMAARSWSEEVTAAAMGFTSKRDYQINLLALQMLLNVHDPDMHIGQQMADGLARAFGVDPQFLINLDEAWRAACKK